MALDASLILGGKAPQLDDPLTIRAKQATLADLMGRQQLTQMQMQGKQFELEGAQRERQDQQTLAELLRQSGGDSAKAQSLMYEHGLGPRVAAFQEQQAKAGKAITDADAARFDLIKKKVATTNSVVASALASNPNPTHEDVYRAIARAAAQYGLSPEEQASMVRDLPGEQWKLRGFLLGNVNQANEVGKQIDMLTGKTELVDKGGAHQAFTTSQLTGQVTPGQSFEKTQTPESVASTGVILQPGGAPAKVDEGVMSAKKQIAQAGANRTSVNLPAAESEFSKELAKLDAKQLDGYRDAADKSVGAVSRVQAMRKAVDSGVYSGSFAGDRTKLANFFETIGAPGVDRNKLANSQEYQKHAKELVLSVLKEGVGSTNISNADLAFVNETVPQLETSPEARTRLLNYIEGRSQSNIDRFQQADAYARKNRTLGGFKPSAPAAPPAPPAPNNPKDVRAEADRILRGGK